VESKAVLEQFEACTGKKKRAVSIAYLRNQPAEVLAAADRAAVHWEKAGAGPREQAFAIRLRGVGLKLEENYPTAMEAYRECLSLFRMDAPESPDVSIGLNDLAEVERLTGDHSAAERDYREALRIATKTGHREGIAVYTGKLGELALDLKD
jgi:hypothetical protein